LKAIPSYHFLKKHLSHIGKGNLFNDVIDLTYKRIGARFGHKNQVTTALWIVFNLDIGRLQFVGHDSEATVCDYLINDNPELVIRSFNGSQPCDRLDKSWSDLVLAIMVGPPKRYNIIPLQSRLISILVTKLRRPSGLKSRISASCRTRGPIYFE